jgi:hypothetical protein
MSYYLLKFRKKGKKPTDAAEQAMIQSDDLVVAKGKADAIAEGSGGGEAMLQLFNETGLVATRSEGGVWSRSG